jgi:hypothetical protein
LNLILVIIGQVFAGKIIKKIVPLFLTLQLLFHTLVKLDFPVNTQTIFDALDDAIKLGALKRLVFKKIESDGYMDQAQDFTENIDS